jgi:hypothetical protein
MSRLHWILPQLKEKFGATFYITPAVKFELVDRPLNTNRFKFEALQVSKLIRDGVFEIFDAVPTSKAKELIKLANSTFSRGRKNLEIMQAGEIESLVCAMQEKADAVIMDERTLRLFIEKNTAMQRLLEHRFKQKIQVNKEKMKEFSRRSQGVKIFRSIELVSVAYKLGILNGYLLPKRGAKEALVDAVLWATKYNGCAVTNHEIAEIRHILLK